MGEQHEHLVSLGFVLFNLLPVGFAIGEEGVHFSLGRSIEEAAIFAKECVDIGIFPAPIQACGEIDGKVVVADGFLGEAGADAKPNILFPCETPLVALMLSPSTCGVNDGKYQPRSVKG